MSNIQTLPLSTSTAKPITTKRVIYRWGHELGDTTEYAIGRQGDHAWIRNGTKLDLSGPVDLLVAIRDALNEVLADG